MNRNILVIGSNGYLGQQVTKLLGRGTMTTHRRRAQFPNSLPYDFYRDEILPVHAGRMVIVFAAAVEMNQPANKLETGMRRLLAQVSECRFIYISSDAVFRGDEGNYSEESLPDPVNEYGRNLVLCENLVQNIVTDSCIIRPSYIYGFINGQLDARLSRIREKLLRGETYTAYNDYFKCPLSVHEIADAVVYLTKSAFVGPIHVAGTRMSAYDFYKQAMEALDINTFHLHPELMPKRPDLMPDTSLDSGKWWRMRDSQPMAIEKGLQVERL